MTDVLNVREIAPGAYPASFLANLDDPRRLWEIAYSGHLTPAAQNALLIIATLADETRLLQAEVAFESFHRLRSKRYNQPTTPYDWNRALKELDGTFIAVGSMHADITLRFHNPSVRDFIENHLRKSARDVEDISDAAVYPEQLVRLQRILLPVLDQDWIARALQRFLQIFDAPSGIAQVTRFGDKTVWFDVRRSPVERFSAFAQLAALGRLNDVSDLVQNASNRLLSTLQHQSPRRDELVRLLEQIVVGGVPGITVAENDVRHSRSASI